MNTTPETSSKGPVADPDSARTVTDDAAPYSAEHLENTMTTLTVEDFPNFTPEEVRAGRMASWTQGQRVAYERWRQRGTEEIRAALRMYDSTVSSTDHEASELEKADLRVSYGLARIDLAMRDEKNADGSPRYSMPEIFLYLQAVSKL